MSDGRMRRSQRANERPNGEVPPFSVCLASRPVPLGLPSVQETRQVAGGVQHPQDPWWADPVRVDQQIGETWQRPEAEAFIRQGRPACTQGWIVAETPGCLQDGIVQGPGGGKILGADVLDGSLRSCRA